MKRANSSPQGNKIPKKLRKQIWDKAQTVEGHPEDIWRKDKNGNIINWQQYDSEENGYGWVIVKIDEGGPDSPENFEAISLKSLKG